jgi:gas vesicle protein
MSDHDRYGGAHLLLAFMAGAVVGACATVLTAPQSGSETRDTLRGWAREAQGRAPRLPDALRGAYREATAAAKKAFVEALEQPSADASKDADSAS